MRGWTRIFGGAVLVGAVFVAAGAVGWAQQPRPQLKPVPVPTPAVPVPRPKGALPLHLALPQTPKPAPPRTAGALAIPTPPAGGFGIVSSGTGGGGRFFDADGGAEAWLGSNGYGIQAFGNTAAGYFGSTNASGYAYVGYGNRGIQAAGTEMGGYFVDANSTGNAYVAYGDYGILAYGSTAGGLFQSASASGYAYVGYGNRGIQAAGTEMGGYFKDTNSSGYADVGVGDDGIKAYGNEAGGYFQDLDSSGFAWVAYGDYGMLAYGNTMAAYFKALNGSGYANIGIGDRGIEAYGNEMGGYFGELDTSAYARVAWSGHGIFASGEMAGGYFAEPPTSEYASVATGTYKIYGNGSVSFVQNHPTDPGAVIVYAAPEGDEVATYTRGTARFVGGEAHVALGDTFKWVTNPDLGLTAHVTPRGDCKGVYVASLTTEEMVVKEFDGGSSDVVFDYLVYGLRIGFEETTVVQEKTRESYIPSMKDHRQLLARRPELSRYTALARYSAGREAMGIKEPLKLERATALKAAIHEFDPAVDHIETPGPPHQPLASAPAGQGAAQEGALTVSSAPIRQQLSGEPAVSSGSGGVVPISSDQDIQARSFSSPREQLATRMAVAGSVEPGDVLVVDREHPESFVRGDRGADPTVVGVVVGEAGVALGARQTEGSSAPVALSGIARCKVDASFGAIVPGDLLVSAPTPGHAMRDAAPLPGTVVGKALEPLAVGQGVIRVLVMLR
jgi:hypothetical protein